jgi:hypothetical protein
MATIGWECLDYCKYQANGDGQRSGTSNVYYEILQWKGSAPKKKVGGFPNVFHSPLCPIPNLTTCTSSLATREPTSVAILSNHLRKRRVMVEDGNVSIVRERWTG